ncbi:MAG: hypothetical protein J2P21_18800 [Chloracidobacterium sp.]|nr:hypothetical protein [Chloracidobacterium sp.]
MRQINDEYVGKMEGATREYSGASSAINSGAAIQRDGINRGTEIEMQAAGVRYDTRSKRPASTSSQRSRWLNWPARRPHLEKAPIL